MNFPLEPFAYSQADLVKAKALVALKRHREISKLIDAAFGDLDGLGEPWQTMFLDRWTRHDCDGTSPSETDTRLLVAASFRILRWRQLLRRRPDEGPTGPDCILTTSEPSSEPLE
jgi:hypothetical protein